MTSSTQIRVRDKHQITLPAEIVKAARIAPNDSLEVEYRNGVILLSTTAAKPVRSKSIMDFAGCMQGYYGSTPEQVQAYLAHERDSWER